MRRFLALITAALAASLPVASACTANPGEWVSFSIDPGSEADHVRITFRDRDRVRDGGNHRWSSSFAAEELAGFDVNGLRAPGTRVLRFALVREAGRLDCSGEGGNRRAEGTCAFRADAAFLDLLAGRGIHAPSRDERFAMMAVDVRRGLIEALATAGYPTPDVDSLIAAAAVGVTGGYIADLARLGSRPASLGKLIEYRALGITPTFIESFAAIGYRRLTPDDLVQLKALDITPAFVESFARAGYRDLPVERLIELKALGVSPEFVRAVSRRPGEVPPIEQLALLQSLQRSR